MRISEAFMALAERCGREFGTPLPKQLLRIGNPDRGWAAMLNPTDAAIDGVEPFSAHLTWGGFPAGIIDPAGGVIAAGEAANEDTFCEWLKSDLALDERSMRDAI